MKCQSTKTREREREKRGRSKVGSILEVVGEIRIFKKKSMRLLKYNINIVNSSSSNATEEKKMIE